MTLALYILSAVGLVAIGLGWVLLIDSMRHAAGRAEAEAQRLLDEDIQRDREALAKRLGARV